MLDVGEKQARGAEHARRRRDQHAAHFELARNADGDHGSVATEGDQRKVAWVAAAIGRHRLHRAGHGRDGDRVDAVRRLMDIEAEGLRHFALDDVAGKASVDGQLAADQILGVEVAQHDRRIRKCGFLAAESIAGRPGHGAGALRPDLDRARGVQRDDAAAARADLGDVDERQLDRVAAAFDELRADVDAGADLVLGGARRLAVLDDRGLCRGAAHVERDHVAQARRARDVGAGDDAGGRPRLDQECRLLSRRGGGHRAAVRLHDVQGPGDAGAFQLGREG